MMRTAWLLLIGCALAGCSSRVQPISVTVLTTGCTFPDGTTMSPDAVTSVDHYQVSISATDLPDPIVTTLAKSASASIPNIPSGSARTMTILGYQGDPTMPGSTVRASGVSQPFDVPTIVTTPITVAVVLRPTGLFAGANQVGAPGTCAKLAVARAGHTATLLQDGRVLIAGGFSVAPAVGVAGAPNELNWVFHPESEIFDPRTGTVISAAPMNDPSSPNATLWRAFHTATLVPSGQVLVLGGEFVPGMRDADGGLDLTMPSTTEGVTTQQSSMVYEPSTDSWQPFFAAPPFAIRSRHVAFYDPSSGGVLMLGGVSYSGDPGVAAPNATANIPAWFAQVGAVPTFTPVYLRDANTDGGFSLYPDGGPVFAAFGSQGVAAANWLGVYVAANGLNVDGTIAEPTVGFISWTGYADGGGVYGLVSENDFGAGSAAPVTLSPVRGATAMVPLTQANPGDHVLIAGGFLSADAGASAGMAVDVAQDIFPGSMTDPVPPAIAPAAPFTDPRGDMCAAALADGRAFTAGGDNGTTTVTDSEVWAVSAATGHPAIVLPSTPMFFARKWHTCTLLQDGSVAVIGGVNTQNGAFSVSNTIEIFTPTPLVTAAQ